MSDPAKREFNFLAALTGIVVLMYVGASIYARVVEKRLPLAHDAA